MREIEKNAALDGGAWISWLLGAKEKTKASRLEGYITHIDTGRSHWKDGRRGCDGLRSEWTIGTMVRADNGLSMDPVVGGG